MLNFNKVIQGGNYSSPGHSLDYVIFLVVGQGNLVYFYLKKLENLLESIDCFIQKRHI